MKHLHQLLFGIWLSTLLEISCFTSLPLSSRKSKSLIVLQSKNTSTDPIKEAEESDDPNYLYYRPQARAAPQGGAFAYTEPNIRRSAETFKMIREIGGVECTNDVYARSPSRFEYWYIGKLARTDGTVGLREAVAKCWNIMEEHAVRLRPVELGREFGNLEIWLANGDTELEMSQAVAGSDGGYGLDGLKKMEAMNLKKMEKNVEGIENVKIKEVGFMCEYVTNTGQGFFIVRDDQGRVMQ
ncbi:hypothetical protein CTEN210_13040 [Chaetoceros tenuissimus]|uniref:Uncharacterized protein n=1 Tax=Chaetoceros tenuissimus TaxID=426638 RepID=A0AAD3D5R7_9STRA|nr:hypothetical protein CTEN210_13040 [Chaetoceros tenuissimus]